MFAIRATDCTMVFGVGSHPSITERIVLRVGGIPTPITDAQEAYFRSVQGIEVIGTKTSKSTQRANIEE